MPLYPPASVSDAAYDSTWDGITIVAPSKNSVWDANFETNDTIKAYQALGSVIKAETLGLSLPLLANGSALADNTARYMAVYIPRAMTVTGVKWYQVLQGNYTADQNNYVALYSYSGGTMTQVAISTNDGNIWKAATGTVASAAFTAPYAANPGIYFVGALYNNSAAVTNPNLGSFLLNASAMGAGDFTNSARLSANVATQNTLPATQLMSGTTGNIIELWFGLY